MSKQSESHTTKDHDTIKNWVEQREGKPSIVKNTENGSGGDGLLRIDFPEYDDDLKHVSWEKFFKIFDDSNLQFLHQKETSDGQESQFCKFVSDN